MRPRPGRPRWRFLSMNTELWDDDVLSELPVQDREQVKKAMMWGRPLPPRLAHAAVQYAPKLQKGIWRGWLFLGIGVAFVGLGIAQATTPHIHRWIPVGYGVVALGWMWSAGQFLLAARHARRAVRDRYWPEQPGPPA